MQKIALTLALPLALLAVTSSARADPYRWCAEYGGRNGGTNCYFRTLTQCRAAISGNGGFCRPNQFYTGQKGQHSR